MVTENKRTEYRRALIRGGVPEVYAHMAASAYTGVGCHADLARRTAGDLLWWGFVWSETDQGHEFWSAIAEEADA